MSTIRPKPGLRPGPDPLPAGKKRTSRLQVALRPSEFKRLEQEAALVGLNISEYARGVILGHRLRVVPPVNKDAWVLVADQRIHLKRIASALEKSGVNLPACTEMLNLNLHHLERLSDALSGAIELLRTETMAFQNDDDCSA